MRSLIGTEMAFTGPRAAFLLASQRSTIIAALNTYRPCIVHNGCAKGRDEEVIELLIKMRLPLTLVCWPADKGRMDHVRALTMGRIRTEWRAIHDPLKRNRMMVDQADWLLAAPMQGKPIRSGSGTWYTINYALKVGAPVYLVPPSGEAIFPYGRSK